MSLTKGLNSSTIVTDVVRDEEIRIVCNPNFTRYSIPSASFTYFLYSRGPFVNIRILRTYWTLEGNVVPSTGASNMSSYVLVKAPVGIIPGYTCNVVCDFFSNISDISGDSSIEISSITKPIDVLCEYVAATQNRWQHC